MIESDSSEMVYLVNGGSITFHPYATLIHGCLHLIMRNWRCQISHIYREANKVAHTLAMMGQYHTWGLQLLDETLLDVLQLMFSDCIIYMPSGL